MEKSRNFFPYHGKILLLLAIAAGLLWGLTGCRSVQGTRLEIVKRVHWTATASGSAEGHGPELAIDGKTNTFWRSGTEEPQWIEVDLARVSMVYAFSLQWGNPYAVEYSLLTSRDGVHWALGAEIVDGDGDWDQVSIEPILARYVKVVIQRGVQGNGAALSELTPQGLSGRPLVEVDGVPVPDALTLLDADRQTVWHSARPDAVLDLDLRSVKPIGSVRVNWGTNGFARTTAVSVSTNREDWISTGTIRAQDGDFDVLMCDQVVPARYVRLSFEGGDPQKGFSVAGLVLRGGEGTARPWAMMELAASHAPEGVYPDTFRRHQNYWAVAGGMLRDDPESLLDESGGFAPCAQSASLAPMIFSDGEVWTARQAKNVDYRLGTDGAPMPEETWTLPSGLKLRIRAMARSGQRPQMSWVQYELRNDSIMTQTGRLCWVARPVRIPPRWAGGGLAPMHRIREVNTVSGWQELWANGLPLFAVPDDSLAFGAKAFDEGDVTEDLLKGEFPQRRSVRDASGLASAVWAQDYHLEPGERCSMVVAAAAAPPHSTRQGKFPWHGVTGGVEAASAEFDREWVDACWEWRAATERYAPKIERPDAVHCLYAQAGWLLSLSAPPAAREMNPLDLIQLRAAALYRAGQAEAARRWVEQVAVAVAANGWVPDQFRPDGRPIPNTESDGVYASQGQFAFLVMEDYRFTGDMEFLQQQYPRLRQALVYLQQLRDQAVQTEWQESADCQVLLEGLLPLSAARPGYPRPAHHYSDQFWALLGWKEGRAAASILGLDGDAAWADDQYRALRASVRRSLQLHMDEMPDTWIPATAESDELDPLSVALLFWPCEETDLVEPHELQSSLDAFYEAFLDRDQPGNCGRMYSDEALMLIPLSAMGRGDYAREVFYALLEYRQPAEWQVWAEGITKDRRQPGQVGTMPDLRAAAAWWIGMRGLAARETGKRLDLFSGAPAEWIQHGEGYRVYGMPTQFGPLDLACYWHKDRMWVEIGGAAEPPEGYRLWWPRQIPPDRVMANGESIETYDAQGLTLPYDFKGNIEVFFPFNAPWPRDP